MPSSLKFNHSNSEGSQTISVFAVLDDGSTFNKIVTPANPQFRALASYLAEHSVDEDYDVEHVHGLVDPSIGIGRMLQTEFGDRVTYDDREFRIDGVKDHGSLARYVRDKIESGDSDWKRFVRFLVRLNSNPSYRAQEAVWIWVKTNGLTITEDGRFLGYKGVSHDGYSISSGPNNFVNGVLYKDGANTVVPYDYGSVVSKRRADVNDAPLACAAGLHVGTEEYAKGWGPRTLTVVVSPEHVVSVPDGNLSYKIRVCELEVLSEADDAQFSSTAYDINPVVAEQAQAVEADSAAEQEAEDEAFAEPEGDGESMPEISVEEANAEVAASIADAQEEEEDDGDFVTEPPEEEEQDGALVEPTKGTGLLGRLVLRDWAAVNPGLARDLADSSQGHKAVARKYAAITTESSVRRYRKDL